MVSERVVISLVSGLITYALMLTGILYTESLWWKVCPYRFDLTVVFAGIVQISTIGTQHVLDREYAAKYQLILEVLICIHYALLILSGAVLILMLAFWAVEANRSYELERVFGDYLVGFILYLVGALMLVVGYGFLLCAKISNSKQFKAIREQTKSELKIRKEIGIIYTDYYFSHIMRSCLSLLDTYGEEWTNSDFLAFVFLKVARVTSDRKQNSVSLFSRKKCAICEDLIFKNQLYVQDDHRPSPLHVYCVLLSDLSRSENMDMIRRHIYQKLGTPRNKIPSRYRPI